MQSQNSFQSHCRKLKANFKVCFLCDVTKEVHNPIKMTATRKSEVITGEKSTKNYIKVTTKSVSMKYTAATTTWKYTWDYGDFKDF